MKHLAIILLLVSTVFGQQRVRPIDLTPETLTLIADSAKAIVSDSLATATNYDSVRAIVSDSIASVTTATETRGIVNDSLDIIRTSIRNVSLGTVTNTSISINVNQVDKKRRRFPEAIAYYDVQSHSGFWDGVQVGAPKSDGKLYSRGFYNSLYLKDGDIAWDVDYFRSSGNNRAYFTASGGTYRAINNGVVYTNGDKILDIDAAVADTFAMTDAPPDTLAFVIGGLGSGSYSWDLTDSTDIVLNFHPKARDGYWRVDTTNTSFTMVDGDYYILEFTWTHHDTAEGCGQLGRNWYLENDDNNTTWEVYGGTIDTTYQESDGEWFTERYLYRHASDRYWFFNDVTYTAGDLKIKDINIIHITDTTACLFDPWEWATEIRDALGYYQPVQLDTSEILQTQIYHMKPFFGLQVCTFLQNSFTTFTSGKSYSAGSNLWTYSAKVTSEPQFAEGDTVFFTAIDVPWSGYKVITDTTQDSIKFNQKSYSAPTDFSGYCWAAEWNRDIDFTFPTSLVANAKNVLVIRGSSVQDDDYLQDTPWSYSEAGDDTSRVLIWFDWLTSLSDVTLAYNQLFDTGGRIFGVMVFDRVIDSRERYDICKRVYQEQGKIYKQLRAPQLDYSIVNNKYWPEKYYKFNLYNYDAGFSAFEFGTNLYVQNDTLWMSTRVGEDYNFNSGEQHTHEISNKNSWALRYSVDDGDSWSNLVRVYWGTEGVKNAGDTVSVIPRQIIPTNDDSLVCVMGQVDTVSSDVVDYGGQKTTFIKFKHFYSLYSHPGNLTVHRFIDNPNPDDYSGSASWTSSNYAVRGDTIYVPCYWGYDHFWYKTTDFATVTIDSTFTGGTAATGNEWTVIQPNLGSNTLLTFTRVESGNYYATRESDDFGQNWTTITPWSVPQDAGVSDPVAAKVLSSGDVLMFFNVGSRWHGYSGLTNTNGRSIVDVQGIIKPNGRALFPNWRPWQGDNKISYFNIYENTSTGVIHVVGTQTGTENTTAYYFKFTRK